MWAQTTQVYKTIYRRAYSFTICLNLWNHNSWILIRIVSPDSCCQDNPTSFISFSSTRCSSALTPDPKILLLLLFLMRPNHDHLGRLAATTTRSPRRPPRACCVWSGGTPGSARGRRGRRCPGWARRRSRRPSARTGALPVSNGSSSTPLGWTWCNRTATTVFRTNYQLKKQTVCSLWPY